MLEPQLQPQIEIRQLPLLETPQNKVKLNISPQGSIELEAEGLTKEETQELTYFALAINSDNALRQRIVKQVSKDTSELFNHLFAFTICTGIALFSVYAVSKIFQQPQPSYSQKVYSYGIDRYIIRQYNQG